MKEKKNHSVYIRATSTDKNWFLAQVDKEGYDKLSDWFEDFIAEWKKKLARKKKK